MTALAIEQTDFTDEILVRGSSFYYTMLPIKGQQRNFLCALFWLVKTLKKTALTHSEPQILENTLAWWVEELQRLETGKALHPVTTQLAKATIDYSFLLTLIAQLESLLPVSPFKDFTALQQYCRNIGGPLALGFTYLNSPENITLNQQQCSALEELGAATELLGFYKHIGHYGRTRFELIPQQWRSQFKLTTFAQLQSDPLPLLTYLDNTLEETLGNSLKKARALNIPGALPVLIAAELGLNLLAEIRQNPRRLLECRVKLTPLRKYWIARRVIRHEKAIA